MPDTTSTNIDDTIEATREAGKNGVIHTAIHQGEHLLHTVSHLVPSQLRPILQGHAASQILEAYHAVHDLENRVHNPLYNNKPDTEQQVCAAVGTTTKVLSSSFMYVGVAAYKPAGLAAWLLSNIAGYAVSDRLSTAFSNAAQSSCHNVVSYVQQRSEDSQYTSKPVRERQVCAAIGTTVKASVNLTLPVAGFASQMLPTEELTTSSGNGAQSTCHAAFDLSHNVRALAKKPSVNNQSAFTKLNREQLIDLAQIVRTNAQAEQNAVNKHLDNQLKKLLSDDKTAIAEAKRHIDNLRKLRTEALPRSAPASSTAPNRNEGSAETSSTPLPKTARQTLSDTLQWCGQVGNMTGNIYLQRIAIAGTSLMQMSTALPQLVSTLSGAGLVAAINPAFAVMSAAIGIIGLCTTPEEDPHLKAIAHMAHTIVTEIHELRHDIHLLTNIVLQGFEHFNRVSRARAEEQRIANGELRAMLSNTQFSVARSQDVILASLRDRELEPLQEELYKVKKWLEFYASDSDLNDEEELKNNIKNAAKILLAYVGENNRLSRRLHSGEHFARVDEPLHVSVAADSALSHIQSSEDSKQIVASKIGYLAHTAQRLMALENDHFSTQPQKLLRKVQMHTGIIQAIPSQLIVSYLQNPFATLNLGVACNPTVWSSVVADYSQFRNTFSHTIDDPRFAHTQSIITAGKQQLELIETLQSTQLFQALFTHYQQAANDVNNQIDAAFNTQNQNLFNEMLARFPHKAAAHRPNRAIDIRKELSFALEDFRAVIPGTSSIITQGKRWKEFALHEPTAYEDIRRHPQNFPAEFVLAEYWGLGDFFISYSAEYSGRYNPRLHFHFNSTKDAKDYKLVLKIPLTSKATTCSALEKQHDFEPLKQVMIDKLKQALLTERKKVFIDLLNHRHDNGFDVALKRLNAYRSLLIAFGHVTGLPENSMRILGDLLSAHNVEERLHTYSQTSSLSTPLPQNVLFAELASRKQAFFADMENDDPELFQSTFATEILSVISGLSLVAQKEHLQRQNEAEVQQEKLQQNQQHEQAKLHNDLRNLMAKYNKLIIKQWQDLWIPRWFNKLSDDARNSDIYKDVQEKIAAVKQKLNTLEKMLTDPAIASPEITRIVKELRDICIEIHGDLKSLNLFIEHGKEYTVTDQEVAFLYDKKLYREAITLKADQHKANKAPTPNRTAVPQRLTSSPLVALSIHRPKTNEQHSRANPAAGIEARESRLSNTTMGRCGNLSWMK